MLAHQPENKPCHRSCRLVFESFCFWPFAKEACTSGYVFILSSVFGRGPIRSIPTVCQTWSVTGIGWMRAGVLRNLGLARWHLPQVLVTCNTSLMIPTQWYRSSIFSTTLPLPKCAPLTGSLWQALRTCCFCSDFITYI